MQRHSIPALAGLLLVINSNGAGAAGFVLQSRHYVSPPPITKREKSPASPKYHFDVWTTDNGLPQNSVPSILQARDGYLWLATYDGLVRYDGVHFTVFNPGNTKALKSSRFSQLIEDGNRNLWIATEDAGLIRYSDGVFTSYATQEGLPDNRILRMRTDGADKILIETPLGLARWDGAGITPYDSGSRKPFAGIGLPVQSGAVWYFSDSALHRVEGGRVTRSLSLPGFTARDVKSLWEDQNGDLWIGAFNDRLLRFSGDRLRIYSQADGLPPGRMNCILQDRRGNLWCGMGGHGLVRFKDDQFNSYTKADGLPGDEILSIYQDREGIVWIGTASGLARLSENIITSYSTEDGLAANNTYPICQDRDGNIFIGGWSGLTKYANGGFTRCDDQYKVENELVTSLFEDRDGALWIGAFGGGARRVKQGAVTMYRAKDGLPGDVVRAIHQDRGGAIWIGTNDGLARLEDGALSVYTIKDGLPGNMVNVLFEDTQGDLWIGTQAGLCKYSRGHVTSYAQDEDLWSHAIRAIYEDKEEVLWIGTYDRGLVRLKDGRTTSYTIKDGLFNNGVFQILEDARGNFWISCNLGIYRLNKGELTSFAEGRIKSITSIPYGKRDGMLNSECNGGVQPAGVKAFDGKLWFPTQGGVAVIDPEALSVSEQPPPVKIEAFLRDNSELPFREQVEVEPGSQNFEIHYTGLSFIMSDLIRFRYKLEGLDADWVTAGTRRVAYYSHIPPGSYTFRVVAANRDGVWNMEGASLSIRIIPPFWRTWWFLSLSLGVLAGAVVAGYKLRVARLENARRAQQAFSQELINSQERERQRIAGELHDGLGQHLLIIKNSALFGLNSIREREPGREQLSDISQTASQAIDEVREISYNLRPYQLDDLGLTKAIEHILAKVSSSSEVDFTSRIDGIDGMFSADAEINVYRIVQEALNNIVKHSRARHANIAIERDERRIRISIRDDGRGFDANNGAKPAGSGGFGLRSIAERARMLGADCNVESIIGQGTTVTLNLEARETQDA